ncbi:MAG TPA: hypothetical protein VGW74_09315 [Propionibacteriaceae bacterium]|nr:hypothetical protein [Propionibacteriaceae bacterium]
MSAKPKGGPILIRCEASGYPSPHYLCPTCGNPSVVGEDGTVAEHQRDDIIARIHRGDFG